MIIKGKFPLDEGFLNFQNNKKDMISNQMLEQKDSRIDELLDFFWKYYQNQILTAQAEDKRFLEVDFSLLDRYPNIADFLLNEPNTAFEEMRGAAKNVGSNVGEELEIRIFNVPQQCHKRIRDLRSAHIGKLIVVDGTVRRASDIRPEIYEAVFKCQSCDYLKTVKQVNRQIKNPMFCDCMGDCGKHMGSCKGKFDFNPTSTKLRDIRYVVIEEPYEIVSGEKPGMITIYLKMSLTSIDMQRKTDPGARVRVYGVLKDIRRLTKGKPGNQLDIIIEANNVENAEIEWEEIDLTPEDEKIIKELSADPEVYKKLIASIAPSIYGLEKIKEAIALQIFGGVPHKMPDGTRLRGDLHILLLGEPATAKSQILKLVSTIMPRGKYVSGKGSSAVGLTASVTKDEEFMGGWVLEAGAMVLANKSLLSIDEFEKMSKEDQIALHEALEQQSYHYDTEITLADGTKHKIGKLVDSLMEKTKENIVDGINCEILPVDHLNILTTDFKKIYSTKVNRISRHAAPDYFIKITYSNGRNILVTPEHPIWILDDLQIKTIAAESLKPDMFCPIPRKIPTETDGRLKSVVEGHRSEKPILMPDAMNTNVARFLGYHASEGHSYVGSATEIGVTNSNSYILSDMQASARNAFGLEPYFYRSHSNVFENRYVSTKLYRFFQTNFPELLAKARIKRAPSVIFRSSENIISSFLSAAFLGDGFVDSERFGFSTSSYNLAKDYQEALLRTGIYSYITEDRTSEVYKIVVCGIESMELFMENILDKNDRRLERIKYFINRSRENIRRRADLPSSTGIEIKNILSLLKIDDGYLCQAKEGYGVTERTASKYVSTIKDRLDCMKKALIVIGDSATLRESCNISQQDIQDEHGIKHQTLSYIERRKNHKRRAEMLSYVRKSAQERIRISEEFCDRIESLLVSDIRWIAVKKVERIKDDSQKWVYDLTVEPTRSFISECLVLHNTISIAKASIIATLPAQTAVLAGANPKYSRFDRARPIGEQTDIPLTLLSRFDLKFVLRDIPDRELDEKMATHIMETRLKPERVEPIISTKLLRKYIAYCRKNCSPEMTRDALEELKNYYIKMRSMSTDETLAITLRQNEALMRLSEASARIRLSPVVTKEDAMRAIDIMSFSIRELAYDFDTGRIDIDRTEGVASSQRGKINLLLDLIIRMEKKLGKQIPREELKIAAREEGVEESVTEELIERLKRDGTLYEPFQGFIARAR